jgi:hypothetical protein
MTSVYPNGAVKDISLSNLMKRARICIYLPVVYLVKVKVKVMLRQTISQYVLVSSSLWNPRPDVIICLNVAVLSLWGALSDERSGLSPVSHCQQCLVHCQRFNIIYIVHVTCFKYIQYILDLSQHRLSTADHANIYATTTASRRLNVLTLGRRQV